MPEWGQDLLTSKEVVAAIIPVVLTAILALIGRAFTAKPRIHWSSPHQAHFLLRQDDGEPLSVFTRDIWLRNTGRETAEDVEIVLNYPPPHMEVFPHLPYEVARNPDNRTIIKFARMNAGEHVNIALFSTMTELPYVTYVRFRGGQGKPIQMVPQRIWPTPFNIAVVCLLLLGIFSAFYFPTRILQSLW